MVRECLRISVNSDPYPTTNDSTVKHHKHSKGGTSFCQDQLRELGQKWEASSIKHENERTKN